MQENYISIPIGLQEFSILGYQIEKREIKIELKSRHPYSVCPHCSKISRKIHGTKQRIAFDLPIHERKVKLIIHIRRFMCLNCNKVFTEQFDSIRPRSRMTIRYEDWICKKSKNISIKNLSDIVELPYSTVRRIFQRIAKKNVEEREISSAEAIGVDEFARSKHRVFDTVITNLKKHRIIEIIKGRDSKALSRFLNALKEKCIPKFFVIDMWHPYRAAIRSVFEHAVIIIDKFHVIALANQSLEKVRRIVQKQRKKGEKREIYYIRHILTKAKEELTPVQKERLNVAFERAPLLRHAYWLKEYLREIYKLEDIELACLCLKDWCNEAKGFPYFKKLAKSIRQWYEPITNYFRYKFTNGYTEGVNNRIKLIKRQAYGYKDFEGLRLKVLNTYV